MRLGTLGPPHGQEPTRQAIRNRQLEQARTFGWPRLEAADLVERPYGIVLHAPSGRFYRRYLGEHLDAIYAAVAAVYLDAAGDVVFLEEPASGPKTLAEQEQFQAEREQRRNAPKPSRGWAKR